MLFILPLIVAAITFLSTLLSAHAIRSIQAKGIIDITFVNRLDGFWSGLVCFAIVAGIIYIIFGINEKFKLLHQTTTLPSSIYVLLTSGIIVNMGFGCLLVSVFLIAMAMERLQTAIIDTKNNNSMFDFGVLITLAVAIYPKLVILTAWTLCMPFFSGRSTLKDIVALLTGLITPILFLLFYYFWTDRLPMLPVIFTQNLLSGEYFHRFTAIDTVCLGVILLLLLISLFHLSLRYSTLTVKHRRAIFAVVSLLVFLSVTPFVIPGNSNDFMYVLAFPLSFLYAMYFLNNRLKIMGNLMFALLLAFCFLTCII